MVTDAMPRRRKWDIRVRGSNTTTVWEGTTSTAFAVADMTWQ
jgi:hypothetical protein